jgi:hypothetical protein
MHTKFKETGRPKKKSAVDVPRPPDVSDAEEKRQLYATPPSLSMSHAVVDDHAVVDEFFFHPPCCLLCKTGTAKPLDSHLPFLCLSLHRENVSHHSVSGRSRSLFFSSQSGSSPRTASLP